MIAGEQTKFYCSTRTRCLVRSALVFHAVCCEVLRIQISMSLNSEQSTNNESSSQASSLEATLERVLDELRRLDCLRDQLASTSQMLSATQAELAQKHAAVTGGEASVNLLDEIQYWQDRYSSLLEERDQLEEENVRLVAEISVARSSHPLSVLGAGKSPESMTWEQRKAAILEQLSREDAGEAIPAQQVLDIRKEVESLAAQLRASDSEIARLRKQLASRSASCDGVAKQPAIAELAGADLSRQLESDSLIVEERRKLQAARQEWEEKLRRAEVELSMERAKLARDRRALEQKSEELEERLSLLESQARDGRGKDAKEEDEPKRRWLKHLGLGDGN